MQTIPISAVWKSK